MEKYLAEDPTLQDYVDELKKPRALKPGDWNRKTSRRTGVIALKVGTFPMITNWFERIVCTCLYIPQCQVIQTKTEEKDGVNALQVGAFNVKMKKVTKPLMGHFAKAGVEPKRYLREFKVSRDCLLPPGTEITARHFVLGQYVDVHGRSKGKGFQGVMKRHNFKGQPASHGVSLTHRSLGSTGGKGDRRVFPGKKMPGHMGCRNVTHRNLLVYAIDIARNTIFVKGTVPGPKGSVVYVRDAFRRPFKDKPPHPTFFPPEDEDIENMLFKDSFKEYKFPERPHDFVMADNTQTEEELKESLKELFDDWIQPEDYYQY